jgi:TrmH family RNA methyltransferase
MGSVFKVNIVENVQIKSLEKLMNEGYNVSCTHLDGSDIRNWKPKPKQIVVFGSEAHGISPEINELFKNKIKIIGKGAESLNVAAAVAVVLYHWNNK